MIFQTLATRIARLAVIGTIGATATFLAPTTTEIERLQAAVTATGTTITERVCDGEGEGESYGWYEYEQIGEIVVTDEVVICIDHTGTSGEIYEDTLRHESTHVAQACLGETATGYTQQHLARQVAAVYDVDSIYEHYDADVHYIELEAFYMEDRPTAEVTDLVTSSCQ